MDCDAKWEGHRFAVIYDGAKPIGYTVTWQEAEAICDAQPHLQWDYLKKNRKLPEGMEQLAASTLQRPSMK
jgi:hypothetical protein